MVVVRDDETRAWNPSTQLTVNKDFVQTYDNYAAFEKDLRKKKAGGGWPKEKHHKFVQIGEYFKPKTDESSLGVLWFELNKDGPVKLKHLELPEEFFYEELVAFPLHHKNHDNAYFMVANNAKGYKDVVDKLPVPDLEFDDDFTESSSSSREADFRKRAQQVMTISASPTSPHNRISPPTEAPGAPQKSLSNRPSRGLTAQETRTLMHSPAGRRMLRSIRDPPGSPPGAPSRKPRPTEADDETSTVDFRSRARDASKVLKDLSEFESPSMDERRERYRNAELARRQRNRD